MALTKAKKVEIVEKLEKGFSNISSAVFVHFKGLSVKDTTELRRKLRAAGVSYTVAKKTLIKRVLGGLSFTGEQPVLDGEIAVAYGTDLLAPAREVLTFQKEHKDKLSIVGGIFDGVYKSQGEMMEYALIPSRETLYAQFVNLINSPIQGLVIGLDAIAAKKQ